MNQSAVPVVSPSTLEVVALGGLGEFGMNMMAVSWEDTTILIDAGVMFPEPDQLGVDLIIPDMSFVESRRNIVKALIPIGFAIYFLQSLSEAIKSYAAYRTA